MKPVLLCLIALLSSLFCLSYCSADVGANTVAAIPETEIAHEEPKRDLNSRHYPHSHRPSPSRAPSPSIPPSASPSPSIPIGSCCLWPNNCSRVIQSVCEAASGYWTGAPDSCPTQCGITPCRQDFILNTMIGNIRVQDDPMTKLQSVSAINTIAKGQACYLAASNDPVNWGYLQRRDYLASLFSQPDANQYFPLEDIPSGSCFHRYAEYYTNGSADDIKTEWTNILRNDPYWTYYGYYAVPYHYNERGYGVLILMNVVPYLNIASHNCYAVTSVEGNPNGLIGKSPEEEEVIRRKELRAVNEEDIDSSRSRSSPSWARFEDASPVRVFQDFIDGTRRTMVNIATSFVNNVWPFSFTDKLKDLSLLSYLTGKPKETPEYKLRKREVAPVYTFASEGAAAADAWVEEKDTWSGFLSSARKEMLNVSGSFLQLLRDSGLLSYRDEEAKKKK